MADEKISVVVEGKPLSQTVKVATKEFRVRDGKTHSHDNVPLQPGDVILLNRGQADAFRDKVEPVDPNAEFTIHSVEEHEQTMRKVHERAGQSSDQQSEEAQRAQEDKARAELLHSTSGGADVPRTFDAAKGTLTKDPVSPASSPTVKK